MNKTSFFSVLYEAALVVGAVVLGAVVVSALTKSAVETGKSTQEMSIEELQNLREQFIQEDSSEGYLMAARIRDMIAHRTIISA